jgi:hypothetical protein
VRTGYTRRMSLAHTLIRRRRQFAFGALTVLLHVLVLDWFSGQLGRRREDAAPAPRAPMVAQVIQPEPLPPPAPVPAPQPRFALPPLPQVPPEPADPADPGPAPEPAPASDAATDAATVADTAAADAAPGAADPAPSQGAATATRVPGGQERAASAAAAVQSQPATASAGAAAQQAPAPQPLPEQRRYKVELPPPADITLDVARTDANGTRWRGEALLTWSRSGSAYRVGVEAGIRVVFTRVNLLTLTSEGTVGDEGFVPILMTEKRRGRAMTATHFNRKDGTLTFSASQAKYALAPGTQDKASLPLQLAAIGRGDPKQLSGNIDILVGEDRDAAVFSFTVAGQEQIDTRLGKVATWHLVRPPKPGSYHSRLEVWLAPAYGWLPVQIRNVEASGAVTTQTASNIIMKEAGSP